MGSEKVHNEIEVSENHVVDETYGNMGTEYEVHTGFNDEYRITRELAERVKTEIGLDLEHGNYQSGAEVIIVEDTDDGK